MGSTSGGFFSSSQILDQLGHELMRIIPKMRKPSASEEEDDDFITPPRCFTVQTIHDVSGSSVGKCSYETTSRVLRIITRSSSSLQYSATLSLFLFSIFSSLRQPYRRTGPRIIGITRARQWAKMERDHYRIFKGKANKFITRSNVFTPSGDIGGALFLIEITLFVPVRSVLVRLMLWHWTLFASM